MSHELSLSICLSCFFNLYQKTFPQGKGLPSGRKKGLRPRCGKPCQATAREGWQNVAQVLPKLGREGKRTNIPVTGIWGWLTKKRVS
jgi:hypothetical protein